MTTSQAELATTGQLDVPQPGLTPVRQGVRWYLFGLAISLAIVSLYLAYYGQAQTLPSNPDGASQALQAWDMLHGNLLLRGWSLTDVTFYTTELPQYMLVEIVHGLSGAVVHICAALTYTLLVILVGIVAKGAATGREGVVRLLIASGILLAPPLGGLSTTGVVLSNPDHTGTQVPLLLIWLVLDRVKPRWWVPILVTAMLIWVQMADVAALYEGVVPLVLVCVVRMSRRRGPWTGQWFDLSLAAGAVFSVWAATNFLLAIRRAGGFDFSPPAATFSTVNAMSLHFWVKLESLLELFGADFFGQQVNTAIVPLLHFICVILVVVAAAYGVRRFWREDNLMVQVVTAAFVVLFAAFMLGFRTGAWEAVGLLPIGAVLAGRLLAAPLISTRLVIPLGVVLLCFAVFLYQDGTQPIIMTEQQSMANWLVSHHLRYGLAGYWHASNITLYSDNQVQVRPITQAGGFLMKTHWNSDASWYDASEHDATFMIWPPENSPGAIYATEGRPQKIYHYGGYLIMVWDKNLLDANILPGKYIPWNLLAAAGTSTGPGATRISPR
jgi:hypothetical protein